MAHRSNVSVYYYNLPLTAIHGYSFGAAVMAERAATVGKQLEVHRALYKCDLPHGGISKVADYYHIPTLQADDDERCKQQVESDMSVAEHLLINATPTIFLIDKNNFVHELNSVLALKHWR